MQSGSCSKDVQLLLWAVGEARDRRRRRRDPISGAHRRAKAAQDREFFTEWQPAGT